MATSVIARRYIVLTATVLCAIGMVAFLKSSTYKSRRLLRTPRTGHVYYGTDNSGAPFPLRFKRPVRVPMTPVQSNAVAMAFKDIATAYVNGDSMSMKKHMESMPDVVTNITDELFLALSKPVRGILKDGILNLRHPRDFSSVVEFDSYVRNSIDLAVFWADSYVRRGDFGGPVVYLDTSVLSQLLYYKEKFHNEGQIELEKCADGYIHQWKNQIDSENGFTRQYMLFQVDLQWSTYKVGVRSLEQLSEFVKENAKGLIRLGHTPKWLSEFDDLSEAVK